MKPEIAQNNMNLLLVVMFSKLSGSLVICGLFETQLYLFRFSNSSFELRFFRFQLFQSVSRYCKQFQAVSQFGDVRFLKFMLKIQQW